MNDRFLSFNTKLVAEKKNELTFDAYFLLVCRSKIYDDAIKIENLEKHKTFLFLESLLSQPAIHIDIVKELFPPLFDPINKYTRLLSKYPDIKNGAILVYEGEIYYTIVNIRLALLIEKLYEYDKYIAHINSCIYYYHKYQLMKIDKMVDFQSEYDQLYDIYIEKLTTIKSLSQTLECLIDKRKKKEKENEQKMIQSLSNQMCASGWDDGNRIIPMTNNMMMFVRNQLDISSRIQNTIHD
jgi:hypothetical protein